MDSASLIKKLEKDGWYLVRIKSSHHHFKHGDKKGLVTIPHPRKGCAKRYGEFDYETGRTEVNFLKIQ